MSNIEYFGVLPEEVELYDSFIKFIGCYRKLFADSYPCLEISQHIDCFMSKTIDRVEKAPRGFIAFPLTNHAFAVNLGPMANGGQSLSPVSLHGSTIMGIDIKVQE